MKIFQITYSLASGGAERFVVDLCNELAKSSGNQVTLVTLVDDTLPGNSHYLPELGGDVEYVCLKAKSGLTLKAIWRLFVFLKERKPNVAHAHCGLIPLFLPALLMRNIKFIQTLHSIAQKTISFKYLKSIYRFFYKHLVTPVTISRVCNESYREYYSLDNSKCVYNGRTPVVASESIEEKKKKINELKITPECPIFVHVARYSEAKNQQMLINVFERLASEGERFLLLIIGNGHENAPYYNKIKSSQIRILGEKNNVGDYLMCADYFVLTSLWEGLPISLLEAMSVGCVPICTPAGGVVDVITNGENGFLSPSFEESDYYNVVKVLFCLELKEKLRERVLLDYENRFAMMQCALKYSQLYKE